MSETPHAEERLGAYLDGELDEATQAGVAAHLHVCSRCRDELENLRLLQSRLQEAEVPDPGAAYWARFGARVEQGIAGVTPGPASRGSPSWLHRGLAWLRPAGSRGWTRLAGAAAVGGLALFIGVRAFSPDERKATWERSMEPEVQDFQDQEPPGAAPSPPLGSQMASMHGRSSVGASLPRDAEAPTEEERTQSAPSPPPAEVEGLAKLESSDLDRSEKGVTPEEFPPVPLPTVVESPKAQRAAPSSFQAVIEPAPEPRRALELEVHHPPQELEDLTRRFVVAALAADETTARAVGEDLRHIAAADSSLLRSVDTWLGSQSWERSSAMARRSSGPPPQALLALDTLAWPHRGDPAWQEALEEVARRLVVAAPHSATVRSRAVAHAAWLAEEAANPAERSRWREILEQLQR